MKRKFGNFKCECGNSWVSANAWEGMRQGCKKCGYKTLPHNLRPLKFNDDDDEGSKPPHIQHLCEMCKKLGYNCRNFHHEDHSHVDDEFVDMFSKFKLGR